VIELCREAACVLTKSPRGSAALLRPAIEALGPDLNSKTADLVNRGLPEMVQQALDVVRVIGNNGGHPGQIDIDDPETATSLFDLINLIGDSLIAVPKRAREVNKSLPQGPRDSIDRRDATTPQ
jgi:hypothetical protein